jgi:hypothetical protein
VRIGAAVLALAAALASGAAHAQEGAATAGDSVVTFEGRTRRVRSGVSVESAGFDKVVVAQGGRRDEIDGADVAEIAWADAPRTYQAAVAALAAGDAAAAADGFAAALRDRGTKRGWLVEHANAGLGEACLLLAHRDRSAAARAAAAFGAARDANPKSLVLDRVLAGLARAEILRGSADAALAAASDLDTAGKSARRAAWESDAAYWRARSLEAKGDAAGAMTALDGIVASSAVRSAAARGPDGPARVRRTAIAAGTRKLRLLVAEAEKPGATQVAGAVRKCCADLVERWPEEPEILAATTNAAGALLLAEGDARRALRKFQETEVVRFEMREEAARALAYEARCHERLADDKRRDETLRALAQTYPETEAAQAAASQR